MPTFGTLGRALAALRLAGQLETAPLREPLDAEVWLEDLQLMAARQEPGSPRGLYLAAWGGHNAQSHNHNDVGNFIVYADGRPVLVDVGVEQYTAKTFGPRRYEIWTMQSAWHNLPTINGMEQTLDAWREALRLSFVTPLAADATAPGRIDLPAADREGRGLSLRYDPSRFPARVEEKPLEDARLRSAWGERLFRVVLESRGRARRGSYRIVVR